MKAIQLSKAILVLGVLIGATGTSSAAKYANEAYILGANARAMAMGGAHVAFVDDASAIYYNPACLAMTSRPQAVLLHSETFGSLVNHDFLAFSRPVTVRDHGGGIGIGLYRVGGGGIILTEKDPVTGGPRIIDEESHYDYQLLLGGGIRLADDWRFGAAAKFVLRSLAGHSAWGLGIDAGLQYGSRESLSIGAALSNATSTFLSYDNGTTESIIPSLRLGLSQLVRLEDFSLRVAADGDVLFEGREEAAQVSAGGVSLDAHLGGEVGYHDIVFFRGGADIDRLTLGIGLRLMRFRLDGAFMDHGDLDNSYRISLNVEL
jgi:hypothetical protein